MRKINLLARLTARRFFELISKFVFLLFRDKHAFSLTTLRSAELRHAIQQRKDRDFTKTLFCYQEKSKVKIFRTNCKMNKKTILLMKSAKFLDGLVRIFGVCLLTIHFGCAVLTFATPWASFHSHATWHTELVRYRRGAVKQGFCLR